MLYNGTSSVTGRRNKVLGRANRKDPDKDCDVPFLPTDCVPPGIDNFLFNFDHNKDQIKDGLTFLMRCALRLELIGRTFPRRNMFFGRHSKSWCDDYCKSIYVGLLGSLKVLRAMEKSCSDPDLLILSKLLCLKLCFTVSQIETDEISELRDELDARVAEFLTNSRETPKENDDENLRDSRLHLQLMSAVYTEKEICEMVLSYISVFKKSSSFSNPQAVYAGRTYCFLRNLSGEIEKRLEYL